MREKLHELGNKKRYRFTAEFVRTGYKSFAKLGDIVSFNARVNTYHKGYYLNRTLDYKLSNPSKVEIINSKHPYEPLPIDNNHALIGYIMKENANFYLKNNRPYDPFYINAYNEWFNKQNHNI